MLKIHEKQPKKCESLLKDFEYKTGKAYLSVKAMIMIQGDNGGFGMPPWRTLTFELPGTPRRQ